MLLLLGESGFGDRSAGRWASLEAVGAAEVLREEESEEDDGAII